MKLKEFGLYADAVRNCVEKNLIYEVDKGFDERLERIEKIFDSEDLDDSEFKMRLLNAQKEKLLIEKVLNDSSLLEIYLDSEVRKRICRFLKMAVASPDEEICKEKAIKSFDAIGFSDALEYFSTVDSAEELRRDLYEQAGFEYIPYEKLKEDLDKAREDFDLEEFSMAKTNFLKASIDHITGKYNTRDYFTCEVAVLTDEEVRLLSSNHSSNNVK